MIVKRLRLACLVSTALLCWALPSPVEAQSMTRGALEGTVTDVSGNSVSGTSLRLLQQETGRSWTMVSRGTFEFDRLPSGVYDLIVERVGFRPLHIVSIPLKSGDRVTFPIELTPELVPTAADTLPFHDLAVVGSPRIGTRYGRADILALPSDDRGLGELSGWSSETGEGFGMQGLPGFMTTVVVGGVRTAPLRGPDGSVAPFGLAHFLTSELSDVSIISSPFDAEVDGGAGGLIRADTRRGTSRLVVEGSGRIGDSFDSGSPMLNSPIDGTSRQLSLALRGPLSGNSATFSLGVDASRLLPNYREVAALRAMGLQVGTVASESHGVDLPSPSDDLLTEVFTTFSRIDWDLSDAHSLTVRTNFSSVTGGWDFLTQPVEARSGLRFEGNQLSTGVEVVSRLTERLDQSVRIGVEGSDRSYGGGGALTTVLGDARGYTLNGGRAGDFRDVTLRASETLHYRVDNHRLKGGIELASTSSNHLYEDGRSGAFLFRNLDRFGRGQGTFTRTSGAAAEADFSLSNFAAFFQDSWSGAAGLEITVGLRADLQTLPRNRMNLNSEWLQLAGLDSVGFDARALRLNPNLEFRWRPGGTSAWELGAGFRYASSPVDAYTASRFLAFDQGITVHRGSGTFSDWPNPAGVGAAPEAGTRLTLLAPGFAAPVTSQGSAELSRTLGRTGLLRFAAAYRHTKNLGRVRDLNLVQSAVAADQYGRPLYGWLENANGLLQAAAGSNRRFENFDQVLSMNSDGWSKYLGLTASIERSASSGWNLNATYTFSRTRDNWLLSEAELPVLSPFPDDSVVRNWDEGISNFDVPHSAFVSLFGPLLPRVRVGGIYRFRSGLPFTPGFAAGMDANGDGVAGNDPAFIDTQIAGMDELTGRWSCLGGAAGTFVERNSCRGPSEHALDGRFTLVLARPGSSELSLVVDGFNLLATRRDLIDSAVYTLEPNSAVVRDTGAGTATVPFAVNSRFGSPVSRYTPARLLRIAVRLSH